MELKDIQKVSALRNKLYECSNKTWEDLFVDNMQKQAGFLDTWKKFKSKDFYKNPAGGEGFKGGLKQVGQTVHRSTPLVGTALGAKIYSDSEGKSPTKASVYGLMPAILSHRLKHHYKKALKSSKNPGDIAVNMSANMLPEATLKGAITAGAHASDYAMNKGPEIAEKVEKGVDAFLDTAKNTKNITQTTDSLLKGTRKDIEKSVKDTAEGVGTSAQNLKDFTSVAKDIGKGSKDIVDVLKGSVSDPIGLKALRKDTSNLYGKISAHLKNNWGKYALGAGGIAGLYALMQYRKRKEEEEKEQRKLKALERVLGR